MSYKVKNPFITHISFFIFLLLISLGFGNFNIKIGFSIKPYMIVSFLLLLFSLRITKTPKLRPFERIMIAYFLWYSFTLINITYIKQSLWYIGVLVIIISVYYIIRRVIVYVSITQIDNYIKKAGIIICVASLIYYIMGLAYFSFIPSFTQIMKYGVMIDRYMFRLMGTINEPNITSIYLSLFFFYYLYNHKDRLGLIGLILTSICVLLTLSRGAYLSFAFTILIIPLFMPNKRRYLRKFLVSIFFAGVASVILWSFLLNYGIDIFAPITDRFTSIEEDSGSGRLDLWRCALDAFYNNPIFGIGLNGIRSYNVDHFGSQFDNYTHNSYLEVLAESGIVGFCLFILMFAFAFHDALAIAKSNRNLVFILATLISILLQMCFISVQHNEFIYFVLILIFRYEFKKRLNVTGSIVMHESIGRQHREKNEPKRLICNS